MRAASRGTGDAYQSHEAYLFKATGMALDEITHEHRRDILAEKKVKSVDGLIKELLATTLPNRRAHNPLPAC